jgi:vitamin B12 transporter
MGIFEEMRVKQMKGKLIRQVTAALLLGGVCWGGTAFAAPSGSLDEYKLDDVVVTAERIPTAKMDTPANVTVITAKEIEENHYSDVAEALSHVNGVVLGRQGSADVPQINGDERVVIMVDGRRLNNDQGLSSGKGRADLKMLPSLKNVDRIEVVQGGGSALYGSDAVGGVINIITKKGKEARTTLDLNTGSWGTHNYEITNEGSDGTLSWMMTAGIQKQGYYNYKMNGASNHAPHSDYSNNSFSLRLDDKLDASSSATFVMEHKSIHYDQFHNVINNAYYSDAMQNELFNNYAISYQFKENKSTPGFVRVFDNYRSANYTSHYNTRLYGIDYQNGWDLGKNNRMIAGLEWHESKSSNKADGYENKEITNKAIYLQDTMKLDNKWSFVPGIRLDHHNMFGNHWTPKAALNYKANDKTQLYASWGRVFRAPTSDDLYWYQDFGYGMYNMYGNPNLKPETGYTETLGVNHQFDKNTSINASIFKSELHDAIYWLPDVNYNYSAQNVSSEKKHGLEISFKKKADNVWSYDVGYSYIHTEADNNSSVAAAGKNREPNGYRFGVHYTKGPWKSNLYGTVGSGLDTKFYLTRSYAIFDFNVSYDFNQQTTMYFKINNLTNQEYSEYPGVQGNRYPAAGRFFQIGMTYSF